jgi:hypothetical protein
MEYDEKHLVAHAAALAFAARKLSESTADPAIATHLPAALAHVGGALEALRLAIEGVPRALVPAGDALEPACRRFDRAAAGWPATYGREGPSYERQAQLHCAFYEAGATLRLSRRACARATELLTDATTPGDRAAPVGRNAATVFA